jgi:hypothetical protein
MVYPLLADSSDIQKSPDEARRKNDQIVEVNSQLLKRKSVQMSPPQWALKGLKIHRSVQKGL